MNDIILRWAATNGIPFEKAWALLSELATATLPDTITAGDDHSEAHVQQAVRMAAAAHNWLLWRNNSGVGLDENGKRTVRYGMCNDSEKLNKVFKSADLIGIKPVLIEESMVGTTIGQFAALECKPPGWRFTGTERETAQQNFLQLVLARGGYGKFSIGGL